MEEEHVKSILAALVMSSALASAASAADLPRTKTVPMVALPAFTWTGFYVGLHAGFTWADRPTLISAGNAATQTTFINGGSVATRLPVTRDGFTGGAQIGYNWQATPLFVLGIEADLSFVDSKGSVSVPGPADPSRIMTTHQKLDWLGTGRLRLGITPVDSLMVYATGGVAFGGAKLDTDLSRTTGCAGNNCQRGGTSSTRIGWAVGVGAEYAFTNNLTVKAEYLYYDLGKVSHEMFDPAFPAFLYNAQARFDGHIARAGVNYRF
jgi:outer membrane immunogenic protein